MTKSQGHQFTSVTDGREGLKLIKEQKFDAVLLDLAMPEFSGTDVIESLVADGLIKKQPIVLFTASSMTDDEIGELIKKGAHSCIRKPANITDLLNKLQKISSEVSG